jgi:hypothetical protein
LTRPSGSGGRWTLPPLVRAYERLDMSLRRLVCGFRVSLGLHFLRRTKPLQFGAVWDITK